MSEPSNKEDKKVNMAEIPSNTYKRVSLSKDVKRPKKPQERICKCKLWIERECRVCE